MSSCTVSVVVPVYNAGEYLRDCLESLVTQDMPDIEIIVINDGSTDQSGEICQYYADNYSFVHFIDKKNEGVSVARNAGLDSAGGKYITFVDADDSVERNYCSAFYATAEKEDSDIVICDYVSGIGGRYSSSFTGAVKDVDSYKKELSIRTLYGEYGGKIPNSVVGAGVTWSKFYRLEFIRKNGVRFVPGLIRAQDTVFFLSLISKTEKVAHLPMALYHYRINNGSICSGNKYIKNSEETFGRLLEEYKKIIIADGYGKEYWDAYYARIIQVLFWHFAHNCFNQNNPAPFFRKVKQYLSILESEPYRSAIQNVDAGLLARREKWLVRSYRAHIVLLYIIVLDLYKKYIRFKVGRKK